MTKTALKHTASKLQDIEKKRKRKTEIMHQQSTEKDKRKEEGVLTIYIQGGGRGAIMMIHTI
jgi:hypothetical protein